MDNKFLLSISTTVKLIPSIVIEPFRTIYWKDSFSSSEILIISFVSVGKTILS